MKKLLGYRGALWLTQLMFYGGMGLLIFSLMLNGGGNMSLIGVVLLSLLGLGCVVGALFICVRYVRCPHCGGFLSQSGKIPRAIPKFCPQCGKKL